MIRILQIIGLLSIPLSLIIWIDAIVKQSPEEYKEIKESVESEDF